jgi:hypothetical protein
MRTTVTEAPRPYRLPTRPLGLRAGVDLDKALAMAADLDDFRFLAVRWTDPLRP